MNEDEFEAVSKTIAPGLEFSLMTLDQQNVVIEAIKQVSVKNLDDIEMLTLTNRIMRIVFQAMNNKVAELENKISILEGIVKNNG